MAAVHEPTSRPVRVALSDDYEITFLGLAAMLAGHPDRVQIVEVTTDARMSHEPDVILFDTFGRLPDDDVKLRRVVAENDAKVVVYSWDSYPEDAARRLGIAGYLHKSATAEEVVAAVVAAHAGEPVATPRHDEDPGLTWPGQVHGLSEREAEMVSFIVRGLSNEDIARRAFLSINTVKSYIRTAYRKIGVETRAQAVAWGFRNGFDSTDETGL